MELDDKLDCIEQYQLELKKLIDRAGGCPRSSEIIKEINNGATHHYRSLARAIKTGGTVSLFSINAYTHFLKIGIACNADENIRREYNELMKKIENILKKS
ncbi:hypothetical protein CEP49_06670 [Mergibacter septicus]|uniref:hypothetical protein n=1 Tax=Mergibacter septicus TaxID=221402 RepID=UPI001178D638|nr:hypothetical protein [Mergibacter septicus]AWX14254.1 hypothetical protein CEP49_06670 [Mergibacter septicus]